MYNPALTPAPKLGCFGQIANRFSAIWRGALGIIDKLVMIVVNKPEAMFIDVYNTSVILWLGHWEKMLEYMSERVSENDMKRLQEVDFRSKEFSFNLRLESGRYVVCIANDMTKAQEIALLAKELTKVALDICRENRIEPSPTSYGAYAALMEYMMFHATWRLGLD